MAGERTELESFERLVEAMDGEYWVFAYGSLAYDQGSFNVKEKLSAEIEGERKFCVKSKWYRGTPTRPGLVLGLLPTEGKRCHAIALKLASVDDLYAVDEREMISNASLPPVYKRMLVAASLQDGRNVRCVAYFAQPEDSFTCLPDLSVEETVDQVCGSSGRRGPNYFYVINTVTTLREHNLCDEHLKAVYEGVKQRVDAGRCIQRVIVPLAQTDFDPTEVAVPWKYLRGRGHHVTFATKTGDIGAADPLMVTGKGLPALFRGILKADENGRRAYADLVDSFEFQNPIAYSDVPQKAEDFDAMLLPGGHAKGMRPYLESKELQDAIVSFFRNDKKVAAICHGTLLVSRSIDDETGKSVLFGRKTTGLQKAQEMAAHHMVKWWLGDYYRTYNTPMQEELQSFLEKKEDYLPGPTPVFRDTPSKLSRGFVHRDGNYLSARWPGDAHLFAVKFCEMLEE